MKPKKEICIKPKFFHYTEKRKEKKIPIGQYQKAGYEKILKFLVKGIPWR